MIKILIADDHPMFREGIRHLLEQEQDFKVVAEAGDGEEAVRLAGEFMPDVVIMDIGMPILNGLEATRQIKEDHPNIAVLVLTIHDDEEYCSGLLEAGAAGYLLKSAYGMELLGAIRSLQFGGFVLHPLVVQMLLRRVASYHLKSKTLDSVEHLTAREVEVLRLAAEGMSNKDIAFELGIGVRTVKGHLLHIFTKMRVGSRTEAVVKALQGGIIMPGQSVEKAGQ
jgi:NarL family two-component system response regulator LiaR